MPETDLTTTTERPVKPKGPIGRYLEDSRNPLNTILLILPIFLIYSVGILGTGGIRNGVDPLSDFLRGRVFGGHDLYYFLFNLAVTGVFVAVALILKGKHLFRPKIYGFVILEGLVYGLLMGAILSRLLVAMGIGPHMSAGIAGGLVRIGPFDAFILSLGAGLWEEIIFRLVLLGGSVYLMTKRFGVDSFKAWTIGILVSSLLFSAIHYVGSLADRFTFFSFTFRFLAGVVFALIFKLRGLAVVIYTHAMYDITVMVF